MRCPFCYLKLDAYSYIIETSYCCDDNNCMRDDMSKYQLVYNNYPTYLVSKSFMIDKYYVQCNYKDNITIVSNLEACFLMNSIKFKQILKFDFNNKSDIINKLKTIMVFS